MLGDTFSEKSDKLTMPVIKHVHSYSKNEAAAYTAAQEKKKGK